MANNKVLSRMYPEMSAGGFTRVDGTVAFYVRVNALVDPDSTVLDLGAGRGRSTEDPVPFRRSLVDLRGKAARVIGADPDPAVMENPTLDQAYVMPDGQTLPLDDSSCDLVVADWVLEHVAEPEQLGAELDRVLKPGGWVCARTPNKWGYIGVGARVVPNSMHSRMLRVLQPGGRQAKDVFPVEYRMNTANDLKRVFPRYERVVIRHKQPPHYLGNSLVANRLGAFILRLLPSWYAPTLLVFVRKPV